ncbi:hypothetical protein BDZ89DRAFT_975313 [Hymenopellis radicata]|nr:hypothetical protein BDZ89DRAFT_975313 [Hymenopellis radicata]
MALVVLRVELPAYSHSFNVQVHTTATVLDVKQSIEATCAGGPRAEGQRLIWRGRALSDDERLDSIWKSPNEPRIVHLAVHPTAWTSSPPALAAPAPQPAQHRPATSRPSMTSPASIQEILASMGSQPPPPPAVDPLAFVLHRHNTAIQVLSQGAEPQASPPPSLSRLDAMAYVDSLGWSWPIILDDEFPPSTPGGVKYTQIVHEGSSYLSLEDASQVPTLAQVHAVRVLSYTLAILKSEPPVIHRIPSPTPAPTTTVSPQLHAILQQLGIRNLPAGLNMGQGGQNAAIMEVPIRNQMPAPDLPQMQMRPFLLPITFLLLRIFLLLYFFAPARKPVMGALILGWALYEIWTRHIRPRAEAPVPPQPRRNPIVDRLVGNNGVLRDAMNQMNQQQPAAAAPPRQVQNPLALLDTVANMNLREEEQILEGTVTERPSLIQKVKVFTTLFFATLHPAVWDRRRALLRQREGRIRTEATAMGATDDGSDAAENQARNQRRAELVARHAGRPAWVQEYVQHVVENDWVED